MKNVRQIITPYRDYLCFLTPISYFYRQNHIIMLVSDLGNGIKERRKVLKITQPDLAELANISINTLYKIERGQANPSISVINKIAEILGMELIFQVKKNNE